MSVIVSVGFWAAFILDIVIVTYAFVLSKRMGGQGLLHKTTLYAGGAALAFGIHHILELLLEGVSIGPVDGLLIAESIEGIAAILLGVAVYQLFKLVRGEA